MVTSFTQTNYEKGVKGEIVLGKAFEADIIPNFKYWETISPVNKPFNMDEIDAATTNKLSGDFIFVSKQTQHYEFIDAKTGNWISANSLNKIRLGAFIAFNMYYNATPFIVRANVDFKNFARKISTTPRVTGDEGYSIKFTDFPSDIQMLDFDVEAFENLRMKIMIENGDLKP